MPAAVAPKQVLPPGFRCLQVVPVVLLCFESAFHLVKLSAALVVASLAVVEQGPAAA
jgi:hypothetical protein